MSSGRVGQAFVLTCFFTAGYGRHRKLGVGFRTAGYGRHRSQWVKQPARFKQADFLLVQINNSKSICPAVSLGKEHRLLF